MGIDPRLKPRLSMLWRGGRYGTDHGRDARATSTEAIMGGRRVPPWKIHVVWGVGPIIGDVWFLVECVV